MRAGAHVVNGGRGGRALWTRVFSTKPSYQAVM